MKEKTSTPIKVSKEEKEYKAKLFRISDKTLQEIKSQAQDFKWALKIFAITTALIESVIIVHTITNGKFNEVVAENYLLISAGAIIGICARFLEMDKNEKLRCIAEEEEGRNKKLF